jgi:hypothetical protein
MRYISDKARRLVKQVGQGNVPGALVAPVFYIENIKQYDEIVGGFVNEHMGKLDSIRLPANPCWIECDLDGFKFCVLLGEGNGLSVGGLFSEYGDKSIRFMFSGEIQLTTGNIAVKINQATMAMDYDDEKQAAGMIGQTAGIATLIAMHETECVEQPLSASRKMIARFGKGRMFKHYTITLPDTRNARGQSHGGTHASPAWHIRRGHMRTLKDGRKVFVRSCEVGSKERGVVLKDYVVGQSLPPPAG